MSTIDYSERIPNNVDLGSNRTLQRALEQWQPDFLNWWKDMGPTDFQAADVYLRTAISVDREGLGQLRPRQDARLPLGHLPRRRGTRPARRLRRRHGQAGLAAGARRVPQRAAPPDRHPRRHRAGLGRAAAAARPHRALAVRPAQPVPGQRRGRPPPVGDGLPAARLLRPRRPRGGRRAAASATPATPTSRASSRPSTSRSPTGCRSSCSPSSPTATASSSSSRSRSRASIRSRAPAASC